MINFDASEIQDIRRRLNGSTKNATKVLVRGLNRTLTHTKTELARKTREEYLIKHSDILQAITTKKSSAGNITAEIKARGGFVLLQKFKFSPNTVVKDGKPKQYKSRVKKQSSLKKVLNMFLQKTDTGNKLMRRLGDEQYPAPPPVGPSIPQMFNNEKILSSLEKSAMNMLNKRIEHEIQYILNEGGAQG